MDDVDYEMRKERKDEDDEPEEDGFKYVPWWNADDCYIGLKRGSCKASIWDTEAEDLVQAKVDLCYCKALHFVTCHGCCNC